MWWMSIYHDDGVFCGLLEVLVCFLLQMLLLLFSGFPVRIRTRRSGVIASGLFLAENSEEHTTGQQEEQGEDSELENGLPAS